jgi:hypothetical protein
MVTGGLAAIVYGEPRLTNDVDVVVDVRPDDVERLIAAFPGTAYYVPPAEVIREEGARPAYGHFNLLHRDTALRADVYVAGNDALSNWGLDRRRRVPIGDVAMWIAPIEYVILKKLTYYRDGGSDRHLRDIAAMVRLSGDLIDHATMQNWIERLDLRREWELARAYTA